MAKKRPSLRRYLEGALRSDLAEKMVFLAGPRQVGKTTLAKQILDESGPGVYLSWDRREDRRQIRAAEWPGGEALVVLDELHKYRLWKRWLKGEFDAHRDRLRFLVTGSARLDVYRRGGDSLQGRYHHHRLHPFTCGELAWPKRFACPAPFEELALGEAVPSDIFEGLLQFGGFPEPLLAGSARSLRRWQKERLDRFFREDVRDLEAVRDLSSIELLADLLLARIGSPLSVNALREDLEVSHRALSHWLEVLERLYFTFSLRPYTARTIRALQKRKKVYLWDYSPLSDAGSRFENVVALHLLKLVHYLEDVEGYGAELHYLRDKEGRELDFLVTLDRKPWIGVEAKTGGTAIEASTRYFKERLQIPWVYQLVRDGERDFVRDGIRCIPAAKFLGALP